MTRRHRWAATKFAAKAGCVGVAVHIARAAGLGGIPVAPLWIAIPVELFGAISIGLIIDLNRPIKSRWRAMVVGAVAVIPLFAVGFVALTGRFELGFIYGVGFMSAVTGGAGGAVIWNPEDADE